MPAELFVDTSAWYPITRPQHPDHGRVAAALRQCVETGARVVTTNLVLAETHTLILSRAGPSVALAFLRRVRLPPNEIVTSSAELEEHAESWLTRYADQGFSLTDAVSFQVMRERRIREALTLDHHFAIAGYVMTPG